MKKTLDEYYDAEERPEDKQPPQEETPTLLDEHGEPLNLTVAEKCQMDANLTLGPREKVVWKPHVDLVEARWSNLFGGQMFDDEGALIDSKWTTTRKITNTPPRNMNHIDKKF